jgi:hypothetical protein
MGQDRKFGARARVQLTLDIFVDDRWGADCDLAQIYKQAEESARGLLRRKLEQEMNRGALSIVGDLKITAILTEEQR